MLRLLKTPFALASLTAILTTSGLRADDSDAIRPQAPPDDESAPASFQWKPAILESMFAFTIAHAERYSTEQGTREAFSGPFMKDYLHDIQSFHGWQDGDGIMSSYIAHPMEGAMAGYIERQNDPRYKSVEFGNSQRYWTSVWRSLAFSTAYNIAWSFGPYGEAGLGNVDRHAPPGLVDLVGSETMGMAWMIGEDAVDRYLIKRIENRYRNPAIRAISRSMLNPIRSYSNILRLKKPWFRDSRPGVYEYEPKGDYIARDDKTGPPFNSRAWPTNSAFELNAGPMFQRYTGGHTGSSCMGAAGEGVIKVTTSASIVIRVDGCQLFGFQKDYSGDALSYMAGPRWSLSANGGWKVYVQALGGGTKITHEWANIPLKNALIAQANRDGQPGPEQATWIEEWDVNGFTTTASGVAAYDFNNGLQVRVLDVGYQHSWVSDLQGRSYTNGLRFTFGAAYRMGPWDR